MGNLTEKLQRFFRSAQYLEWKKILSEFDLMSKIPFIAALVVLIYLAILSSLLNLLTVGFSNPLAFVHSESEFWLETNDDGLTYYLTELASYQPKTNISVSDLIEFQNRILNEYETENPGEYRTYISWADNYHRQWSKYYQAAIAVLALFLYVFVRALIRKNRNIYFFRLSTVIAIVMITILATRYISEQYVEKESTAKMYYVDRKIRNDPSFSEIKLNDEDIQMFECHLSNERNSFKANPSVQRHFWISRYFESILPREFKANSEHPWSPPSTCQ